MNILIFGGRGMLGHKLVQRLSGVFDVRYTLHGPIETLEQYSILTPKDAIADVNVEDLSSVRRALEISEPGVVINSVGVIKQQADVENLERTLSINAIFPHRLAQLSTEFGCRMIQISTDCVFAGDRGMYSERDAPDALDLYGQSKRWGEVAGDNCLTIRTSIIGRELGTQKGLLEWLISKRGQSVTGYTNAIFSGFPTIVFADIIIDIIEKYRDLNGIFHVSSKPISKFDLLDKINRQMDLGVHLVKESDFIIDRSLDCSKLKDATGFEPLAWDEMIERMAADTTQYDSWNDRKF